MFRRLNWTPLNCLWLHQLPAFGHHPWLTSDVRCRSSEFLSITNAIFPPAIPVPLPAAHGGENKTDEPSSFVCPDISETR
ncbi:hypothetical protein FPQ18DRAFT_324068 [Pyronema domesticum]|nr:hypothetical protein FPQ18DRAFT_324068 [Pyronema domesticum]